MASACAEASTARADCTSDECMHERAVTWGGTCRWPTCCSPPQRCRAACTGRPCSCTRRTGLRINACISAICPILNCRDCSRIAWCQAVGGTDYTVYSLMACFPRHRPVSGCQTAAGVVLCPKSPTEADTSTEALSRSNDQCVQQACLGWEAGSCWERMQS